MFICRSLAVKNRLNRNEHRLHIDRQKSAIFNWFGWVEKGKYWKEIYDGGLL